MQPFIKKIIVNRQFDSPRLVLFAHHDDEGKIDDYVLYHLEKLRDCKCNIVFISKNNIISDELSRIELLADIIAIREDVGRDFGAWRDAYIYLRQNKLLNSINEIILLNDSVYGPLFDLKKSIFDNSKFINVDIVGVTDSWDRKYHLQSYFLWFRNAGMLYLDSFFEDYRRSNDREVIIDRYEVGLSQQAITKGLSLESLCETQELQTLLINRINNGICQPICMNRYVDGLSQDACQTHFMWKELVEEMQCPYMKRDLLAFNRNHFFDVYSWRSVVSNLSDYPTNLILKNLRRIAKTERKTFLWRFGEIIILGIIWVYNKNMKKYLWYVRKL